MNMIVRILKNAREKVAHGWIQHRGQSPDGRRVCAVMAINMSVSEYLMSHPTERYQNVDLLNLVGDQLMVAVNERFSVETLPNGWPSIPFWNDVPGRTQDEVVETFDHAIKTAEAEERDD